MPEYRRLCTPGASYFFTVNLADRQSDCLVRNIATLRRAVALARARRPFLIDAWVVLPDHLHAIWTLPEGDSDFSTRWAVIKRLFSWHLDGCETLSASRLAKRERGIWQRRFWEHMIRDDTDFRAHMDYVHFNPVKHGFVSHPRFWPYSSYRRAVARGEIAADDDPAPGPEGECGERSAQDADGSTPWRAAGCTRLPGVGWAACSPPIARRSGHCVWAMRVTGPNRARISLVCRSAMRMRLTPAGQAIGI